jgi:hypothetical protein
MRTGYVSHIADPDLLELSSDASISFISSHLYFISASALNQFPFSTLFQLLSHDSLWVSSEDDLYNYISSRISAHPDEWDLLRFVRFEYLSSECISAFVRDLISECDFAVDRPLWTAICRRTPSAFISVPCPLPGPKSMDGIMSYLSRKISDRVCPNVHYHKVVLITSSSQSSNPGCALSNLGNVSDHGHFESALGPGFQWVCWDFQERRVRPTHYALRSANLNYPRSWVLEGSLDRKTWTELDRQTDNSHLTTYFVVATFPISVQGEYRYIRLKLTAANHSGNNCLHFCGLELFGSLLDKNQ